MALYLAEICLLDRCIYLFGKECVHAVHLMRGELKVPGTCFSGGAFGSWVIVWVKKCTGGQRADVSDQFPVSASTCGYDKLWGIWGEF